MIEYDLHIHTNASDGILSPEEIIDMAYKTKLKGISITDHDTLDGLAQAEVYLMEKQIPVEFIPGIELNTEYKKIEVHILGYYINYKQQKLINYLAQIKKQRFERAKLMVEKLNNLGFYISFAQVERLIQGDSIGRPHIAMALIEKGYTSSIEEAFEKLLGQGKPAYVPRYKFLPQEAIALIKDAGGIAVLAHPGLINDKNTVDEILKMGLDGIEVFYPQHTQDEIDYFMRLCRNNKLTITGGSDFHGTSELKIRNVIGICGLDEYYYRKLKQYMSVKKTL